MFIRSDTGHNLIQFKLESACFFLVFLFFLIIFLCTKLSFVGHAGGKVLFCKYTFSLLFLSLKS